MPKRVCWKCGEPITGEEELYDIRQVVCPVCNALNPMVQTAEPRRPLVDPETGEILEEA